METLAGPLKNWRVTDRIYGPINKPSAEAIEAIGSGVSQHSEDLRTRLTAALTVIEALRLCQPDVFASKPAAEAVERIVGVSARNTVELYYNFEAKQWLKEVTAELDQLKPAVLDSIDQIAEAGEFPSAVRGLSEAIVRHIYKQEQPAQDRPL